MMPVREHIPGSSSAGSVMCSQGGLRFQPQPTEGASLTWAPVTPAEGGEAGEGPQ